MKVKILIAFLITSTCFSQVGINTTEPTAALDINGDLRIRTLEEEAAQDVAQDSVLVMSRNGTVKRIAAQKIHNSYLKSIVKGSLNSNASWTSSGSGVVIPFEEEIDLNDEYDDSSYTFTAKQDGIYQIYSQVDAGGGIAVSTNFGLRIIHNNVTIAEQSFANLGISLLNLTPPVRNVQTLVQLSEGDTISFEVFATGISLSLLGNGIETYFTIQQIR